MKLFENIKKILGLSGAVTGVVSGFGMFALNDAAASEETAGDQSQWRVLDARMTPISINLPRAREILEKEYDLAVQAPLFYRIHEEQQMVEITDWENFSVHLPVDSMRGQPRSMEIT